MVGLDRIKGYIWERYVRTMAILLSVPLLGNKPVLKNIRRILIYHNLDKECIDNFDWQISYYMKNYKIVALDEFIDSIGKEIDENILCITFDDAYKSVYENAVPILDKYGVKACIFVPNGFINSVDKKRYIRDNLFSDLDDDSMTWDQLKELVNKGYSIGAHSWGHVDFGKGDINYEIEAYKSKVEIEKKLGYAVKYWAFPFGKKKNISQESLTKIKSYGYLRAFSGIRKSVIKDEFLLPRTHINPRWRNNIIEYIFSGRFDNN